MNIANINPRLLLPLTTAVLEEQKKKARQAGANADNPGPTKKLFPQGTPPSPFLNRGNNSTQGSAGAAQPKSGFNLGNIVKAGVEGLTNVVKGFFGKK